jgi:hypothetical protein
VTHAPGDVLKAVERPQPTVLGVMEGPVPGRGNMGFVSVGTRCLVLGTNMTENVNSRGNTARTYIVLCGGRLGWLCHDDMG